MDIASKYKETPKLFALYRTIIVIFGFLGLINTVISLFLRFSGGNYSNRAAFTTLAIVFITTAVGFLTALGITLLNLTKNEPTIQAWPLFLLSSLGAIYWLILFRIGVYYNPLGFVMATTLIPITTAYLLGWLDKIIPSRRVKPHDNA